MDIKELNKTQLIFLGLLLSFVTSIATSIMTVSLMQQAPASVTVPINRVVQQTVEKIQQVEGKTITQTVVVKEEDLVVDAIQKNQSSTFILTEEVNDELGKKIEISAGKAFAVNKDGVLVADGNLVPSDSVYYAKNNSGKFRANFVSTDIKAGLSFLRLEEMNVDKVKPAYDVPAFGTIDTMKVGQKILVVGSTITTLMFDGNKDLKLVGSKANAGSMVLNLDGEVIGMSLYNENPSFLPTNTILEALKKK